MVTFDVPVQNIFTGTLVFTGLPVKNVQLYSDPLMQSQKNPLVI